MHSSKVDLSIIIPVFNEQGCLPELIGQLDSFIKENLRGLSVEVIFADDHSSDSSPKILSQTVKDHEWARTIRLLKNSGSHIAIYAGLSYASGNCAYIMGADLQDPLAIIPEFLEQKAKGHKIVLGERAGREDPLLKKIPSAIFNFFMSKFILPKFPTKGGDVFLIDRDIINAVLQCNEKNVNIFVLILSLCTDVGSVSYHRKERFAGESKWNITKLFKLAFDSVITVGYLPIKSMLWLGVAVLLISIILSGIILGLKLTGATEIEGWASILLANLFLGSANLISTAIIGEYLWRNFDQTRKRPMFIIEKELTR